MDARTRIIAPAKGANLAELQRRLDGIVQRDWQLKLLPFGWVLVVYYDTGVGDHPLREGGGREDGKCAIPWYLRNHEVAGFGSTPMQAAHSVLSGGKGARLRALQISGLDGKRHLVFKNLDNGQIVQPTARGLIFPRQC